MGDQLIQPGSHLRAYMLHIFNTFSTFKQPNENIFDHLCQHPRALLLDNLLGSLFQVNLIILLNNFSVKNSFSPPSPAPVWVGLRKMDTATLCMLPPERGDLQSFYQIDQHLDLEQHTISIARLRFLPDFSAILQHKHYFKIAHKFATCYNLYKAST